MSELIYEMSCQSERSLSRDTIYERLFDKKVDKRSLESSVHEFINLNLRLFNFLGINVYMSGIGTSLKLYFNTDNFIGAIPLKMPYDGIVHKDFQVKPRFDNSKGIYAELTQLLSYLDYSIQPEYAANEFLSQPLQLRPPLYYEAVKYLDLYEKAYRQNWVKFSTKEAIYPYPKAGTNWGKHALWSSDPRKALLFPVRDNVLSTNHKEWQELKYVFELAQEEIISPAVPVSIRFMYGERVLQIARKVADIKGLVVDTIATRSGDPPAIKAVKKQANIILKKASDSCEAWRMDIAELFERYVQFVVARGTRELSGTVIANERISGKGEMTSWGLRYLEPDIMVKIGDSIYAADAKYKANFYATGTDSILKETHRSDLHQLLAYCSFEPQSSKAGILFYPAKENKYKVVDYAGSLSGVRNRVVFCGLQFNVAAIEQAAVTVKELFQKKILSADE